MDDLHATFMQRLLAQQQQQEQPLNDSPCPALQQVRTIAGAIVSEQQVGAATGESNSRCITKNSSVYL